MRKSIILWLVLATATTVLGYVAGNSAGEPIFWPSFALFMLGILLMTINALESIRNW